MREPRDIEELDHRNDFKIKIDIVRVMKIIYKTMDIADAHNELDNIETTDIYDLSSIKEGRAENQTYLLYPLLKEKH